MLVLGGRVNGGRMYGTWPGLASAQLEEGVDLRVTTDYRRVLLEAAAQRGRPPKGLFPGLAEAPPLGLFRT